MWKLIAGFIPGGQIVAAIATAAGAVFKAAAWLFKTVLEGITSMSWKEFVAAGAIALVAAGGGMRLGLAWNTHVANKATQQLNTARKQIDTLTIERDQWKERLDAERKDHADAVQAREKAVAEARAARARMRESERLRNASGAGSAKAGSKEAAKTGLFGLPALSW